jgi:serine/threonine-protein kinase
MIAPRKDTVDMVERRPFSTRKDDVAQIEELKRALASRYVIEGQLGEGGMALVYRARDLEQNRIVALKVLRPEMTAAVGAARFLREIEIERRLEHPNILPMLDWGWAGGSLYYAMPCVDGETLRDRIQREQQLPLDDALTIAHDVADALDYAHAQGVIHRDVKPANILLGTGPALVADFGIARAVTAAGGEQRLTGSGVGLGTPEYMSPEQTSAASSVDNRTDVYALGCVIYEMLAGEPPFTGATVQVVTARHAKAPPPFVRTIRPSLPPSVDTAIHRALAKKPADRFATAGEFVAALTAAAEAGEAQPDPAKRAARRREQMAWFKWPFK